MAKTKEFDDILDDLFIRRTWDLRRDLHLATSKKPKEFSPVILRKKLEKLQKVATEILLRHGIGKALRQLVNRRYQYRRRELTGHGADERFEQLKLWAKSHVPRRLPVVYSFWRGRRCLYVGRTGLSRSKHNRHNPLNGHVLISRLNGHKDKRYFRSTGVSFDVFGVSQKRQLGEAECLAMHLYNPRDNERKAAHHKWGSGCQICKVHDHVREDLASLFKQK